MRTILTDKREKTPKTYKVILILFLVFGVSFNGYSQTDSGSSVPIDSFTEEQYQMFRGFYYDSIRTLFEIVEHKPLTQSLEEFKTLPLENQIDICLISIDHDLFRSVLFQSFERAFGRDAMVYLSKKMVVDLAGMEGPLTRQINPEEKRHLLQTISLLNEEVEVKFDHIIEKNRFCIENSLVRYSPFQFTYGYVSVPMEFQLRELYKSQMPLIRWIQENIPPSEEKEYLQSLIESMERKYLLTLY